MRLEFNIRGIDEVIARLEHTAELVHKNGRKTMHRAADQIVKQARINAPVLSGDLEDSIRKERAVDNSGRLVLEVVAGFEMDERKNLYVALMHENYESIINDPPIDKDGRELRVKTREKQALYPNEIIGGKFVERAAEKYREKLLKHMADVVTRVANGDEYVGEGDWE